MGTILVFSRQKEIKAMFRIGKGILRNLQSNTAQPWSADGDEEGGDRFEDLL